MELVKTSVFMYSTSWKRSTVQVNGFWIESGMLPSTAKGSLSKRGLENAIPKIGGYS